MVMLIWPYHLLVNKNKSPQTVWSSFTYIRLCLEITDLNLKPHLPETSGLNMGVIGHDADVAQWFVNSFYMLIPVKRCSSSITIAVDNLVRFCTCSSRPRCPISTSNVYSKSPPYNMPHVICMQFYCTLFAVAYVYLGYLCIRGM